MAELEILLENLQIDMEEAALSGMPKVQVDDLRRQAETLRKAIEQINTPVSMTLKEAISRLFSVEVRELFTKTRKRDVVNAKQVFYYVLMTAYDLPGRNTEKAHKGKGCKYLSRIFGCHHSTILHSVAVVADFLETERFYKDVVPGLINGVKFGYYRVDELKNIKIKQ